MKRLAVIMISGVLLLGACSSEQTSAPSPVTVTETAEVPNPSPEEPVTPRNELPPPLTQEEALQILREQSSYFNQVSDSSLIQLFRSICSAFDRGASVEDVVTTIIDNGVPPAETGSVVAAATLSSCYNHAGSVQHWVDSNGG